MRKSGWLVCVLAVMVLAVPATATEMVPITPDQRLTTLGANPIAGVPQYTWDHGCSPTSGGMLVGYYDSHPSGNWADLVDGDISTYNTLASDTIASAGHITDYWGTPDPYIGGAWTPHADDCIADFMHTSRSAEGHADGGTGYLDIPIGLEAFTEWDNPGTVVNEAYNATAWTEDVGWWGTPGQDFTYADFMAEIDAGHPMMFGLLTYYDDWYGHSVVAYGYQDDMFQIKVPIGGGGTVNVTAPGFAVWDTWDTSSAQSEWVDWDDNLVYSVTDGDGREWWPFVPVAGASWIGIYDWIITDGVYYHPEPRQPPAYIPEPCTLVLLGAGLVGVVIRRKRKK